jgi:hypothetical protein
LLDGALQGCGARTDRCMPDVGANIAADPSAAAVPIDIANLRMMTSIVFLVKTIRSAGSSRRIVAEIGATDCHKRLFIEVGPSCRSFEFR